MTSLLISPAELAETLGVSIRTLARWNQRRIGPARVRVGRLVGYRPASIEAWLAEAERREQIDR